MRHLSDGSLRRLYDEPYALDEEARAHYNDCPDCQTRFTAVADDARRTLALMAVPGVTVDPAGALARVKARANPMPSRLMVFRGSWRRPAIGGLVAAAVALGLVGTMAFTPLASTLTKIFQPSQVTPVTIGQNDLTGLDTLSQWGDVKAGKQGSLQQTETAAEAAKISGLPVIKVSSGKLPAELRKAPVSYAAITQSTGSVTFNNNAPAKLRGTTVSLVVGPAETAVYGDVLKAAQSARAGASKSDGSTAAGAASDGAQSDGNRQSADRVRQALASAGPILAVAEMQAPEVSSTGASVADIKSALLAQPGLSPTVRAAISGIDTPTGNLPIPIPAGYVNAHSVKVQGVTGQAFGDNTGLGSAIIWIKNGRVYGVAGTVTEDEALAVANSLG
ncbi:MAG TPA: hypothetical protein VGO86_11265 [Candidatus Dormibacteraeota bacterium]